MSDPPRKVPPKNDRLLRALRREPVDRTPVWFMRQAGRSLPRYREIRSRFGFAELLEDAERIAQITALPLERYDVDAAVLFMDLSTPLPPAGIGVEFREGVGPVPERRIGGDDDLEALRPFDPREALPRPLEAIRLLVERLEVPVIGFVGAPFTLCSYLVEGSSRARRLQNLKALIWREPDTWARLAGFWAQQLARFAIAQAEAGASVVQVFDSWAGDVAPELYESRVLPPTRALFDRLRDAGVPSIHFASGGPALLRLAARAGGDAVSVDWRTPIDEAWEAVGTDRAIQGNLDPAAVLAGREPALRQTRRVLERVAGRPGHIFNLGHGVPPETDPEVLAVVVEAVHGGA